MRLDRAIMKMRLERAFLLDELRKRTDTNVDGSDGSGDEGMQTPPPDRPYRDKRRRQQSGSHGHGATAAPANTFQQIQYAPPAAQTPSGTGVTLVPGPDNQMVPANAKLSDGRYVYVDPARTLPSQAPALPHGSPYGPVPTGLPSGAGTQANGEAASQEREESARDGQENGDRPADAEPSRGAGGFSAINS